MIFVEIDATMKDAKTVLMYAHWDKQPPLEGKWAPGLGPFTPVIKDGFLYGRGCIDDGYGSFAAILSIKACQHFNIPHPRIVMTLESAEESSTNDLEYYLKGLVKTRIPAVDYVICLDSGGVDPNRIWLTSSLRGVLTFDINVKILKESVHSGDAGGIVPESFRICRILLNRLEKDGKIIEDLHVKIPEVRIKEAKMLAEMFGPMTYLRYPFVEGAKPENEDPTECLLNQAWRPALAIIGADGLPAIANAGNVLRDHTILRISIRIPPTLNAKQASDKLIALLQKDPPYNAQVVVTSYDPCDGWNANEFKPEFDAALNAISQVFFKSVITKIRKYFQDHMEYWAWGEAYHL